MNEPARLAPRGVGRRAVVAAWPLVATACRPPRAGGWAVCQDARVGFEAEEVRARPAGASASPSLVVRSRTGGDLDECVRLLADVHRRDGYPMRWPDDPAGWLAKPDLLTAWVAELDGRLMGHVALSRAGTEDAAAVFGEGSAMVSRLFVSPAARGHGTGAALLRQAVREARQRGLHPVLEVVAASSSAVAFYERLGWCLVGSARRQWGPDLVIVRQYAAPG
jgi:GNAT superfamily N-acetyltransferase